MKIDPNSFLNFLINARVNSPLSTIICEKYSLSKTSKLADALDDLFSPNTNYGWSSSGIYCFWDPNSYEILYIGLATDIATRFRQHNGLISVNPKSCKFREINKWLKINDSIGYSVLAQSSLNQTSCRRFNMKFDLTKKEMIEQYGDLVQNGYEAIVNMEGLLIEEHEKESNKIPRWNKIKGFKLKVNNEKSNHVKVLKMLSNKIDDWMVARKSFTELSKNETYLRWELDLHAIRFNAILMQSTFKDSWNSSLLSDKTKDEIISNAYLPSNWIY